MYKLMTDKQQSVFFFLIVFLFASGAGLLVYKQYDTYYQEKIATDLEAGANLPVAKISAPTVLADGRLRVDSPKEGSTVGQTFTVSGYAQGWFEGNVVIKVFDGKNQLLYQGNAIAGDNYDHPAPFSKSIVLTAISTTPTGKIEFNDYSAKDGSLVYQKVVNIKFTN
jgi:Immunoglobulin-like domain of bacterial spore germination